MLCYGPPSSALNPETLAETFGHHARLFKHQKHTLEEEAAQDHEKWHASGQRRDVPKKK
jgi:hypothetical protein